MLYISILKITCYIHINNNSFVLPKNIVTNTILILPVPPFTNIIAFIHFAVCSD